MVLGIPHRQQRFRRAQQGRPKFFQKHNRNIPRPRPTTDEPVVGTPDPVVGEGVHLPYPDSEFTGHIEERMKDSTPDYPDEVDPPEEAPNIVIIMTDDVGFGAADTFGGPAHTPTMTEIGDEGLTYNRFHTTSVCSATRAGLLTGRYPHNVATGWVIDSATGYPGYCSVIPKSCASVGQILRMNGYSTGWFGKNHNTPVWQSSVSGPYDQWPNGLGFERFYGFNGGETDQYHPHLYSDTVPIEPSHGKPDYHLDTDLADEAIQFIRDRDAVTPDKPFFIYYAPGATHSPHHVPPQWIEKYKGKFSMGWDALRAQTMKKQKELGIIPEDTELTERPDEIPAWDDQSDEDKEVYCRMMEVYCAFLEFTDHNIGRVLNYIDEIGRGDNTLVMYIQGDNGGSAEGTVQGTTNWLTMLNGIPEPKEVLYQAIDELGSELHNNNMPISWAWALNSPMKWLKQFASHFGGTRNGMVVRWPDKIVEDGVIRSQFHHVIDIMPTVLEAAGVPTKILTVNGTPQMKIDGVSMMYTFLENNTEEARRSELVFELGGNRGLYKEGWMLSSSPVSFPWMTNNLNDFDEDDTNWELYDLEKDFSQSYDYLSTENNPSSNMISKKEEMVARFKVLAKENNIFPLCFSSKERRSGLVGRPLVTQGYGKFEYPNNVVRIPEPSAPDCKNVSFSIKAEITVPIGLGRTGLEGVIMSMGGKFCGMGLIVLDGYPVWVYNLAHWDEAVFKIKGPDKLRKGNRVITVNFNYSGRDTLGGGGTFTMLVDGREVGSVSLDQSVRSFFSLSETLDIGQDTGTPLVDDYLDLMPFKFNGEIKNVTFILDDSNLSGETKLELEQLRSDYMAGAD